MRAISSHKQCGKLGAVALVVLALLLGPLRPLVRAAGRDANHHLGCNQRLFLSEAPTDVDALLAPISRVDTRQVVAPLASTHTTMTRRPAYVPIPVRWLKLPPRTTSGSLPSH